MSVNNEVSRIAQKIVVTLRTELEGSLLDAGDQCMIVLSAAFGLARRAGWTREQLVQRAAMVWDQTERGTERKRADMPHDFDLENPERKIRGS